MRIASTALTAALISWSLAASADGVVTNHGVVIATAPAATSSSSDDATDLSRALSGLAFGVATVTIGADPTPRAGAAGGVAVDAVSGVYPFGTVTGGHLAGSYLPDHSTFRVDAAFAKVDALLFCRDSYGVLHTPILGHSRYECDSDGRLGVGGAVAEVAWDPRSRRVAARWAELLVVVNLAGRASSMAYLDGHVDAALGATADSVWHGRDDARSGSDQLVRGAARVTAVIRSHSARWESSATVDARPAIAGTVRALHDIGVTGEARVRYHVLVGETAALSIGLLVHAAYWSDPSTSNSALDPVTTQRSLFAGLTMEWRHESPR